MNPQISANGRSFYGAWLYYMHDKETDTRDRIDWFTTENMLTDNPDLAWKVMAYTAKNQDRLKEASGQKRTGAKTKKPVLAYSLNWHPEQSPDREHMLETARASMKMLGLEDHEAMIVAHRDTKHSHVHLIVNRINPETGLVNTLSNSKRKLSDFALEYAKEHGLEYSPQREENKKKREKGESTRYRNPVISDAWEQSDNGASFRAALKEQGFDLARGRKRIVVVDKYGKTHNPVRHIEGIKTKELNERLADLKTHQLPNADRLSLQIQANLRQRYFRSRRHDNWAARRINKEQIRHHEQQSWLRDQFDTRIDSKKTELKEFYRFDRQKEEIADLEKKTERPSLWARFTGKARARRRELSDKKRSFENAAMRYDEAIDHLENQKGHALESQAKKQARRKEITRRKIQESKPSDYMDENQREITKKEFPEIERKTRDGPTLDR